MSAIRLRARRHESKNAGSILMEGSPVACVLKDVSETGARLSVPNLRTLPDRFDLTIAATGRTIGCRTVWESPGEFGVRFVAQHAG